MVEKESNPEADILAKQEETLKLLDMDLEQRKSSNKENIIDDELEDEHAGAATSQVQQPMEDPDDRSVFVKNVDFSADDQQLIDHFKECGEILRVTIRRNPHTQQSLG